MEISLNQVEVAKLDLQPGQTLVVTIKSDLVDQHSLDQLGKGFRSYFPDNKIMMLSLGPDDSVQFSAIQERTESQSLSCANSPVGYCSDCNCGKREQVEGAKE